MHSIHFVTKPCAIHTMTFTQNVSGYQYTELKSLLYNHKSRAYSVTKDPHKYIHSDILSGFGLEVCLAKYCLAQCNTFKLKIRVNPRKLIEPDCSPIATFIPTEKSINTLLEAFNSKLAQICPPGWSKHEKSVTPLTMERMYLHRVDLCIDTTFPSKEAVETVIKLMKRSLLLRGKFKNFRFREMYSQTAHRKIPYHNELHIEGNAIALNYYNKQAQLEDNIEYYKNIPVEAVGLLRFELQMNREKLSSISQVHNISIQPQDIALLLLALSGIASKEMATYSNRLFGNGEYHTLPQVRQRLYELEEQLILTPCIAQYMEELATDAAQHKGMQSLQYLYRDKELKRRISLFNDVGINPYPLPNRFKKTLGSHFPSVSGLLKSTVLGDSYV